MKRYILAIIVSVLPLHAFAYPTTFLEMTSDPGDWVGQGQSYYFTESDGTFSAGQQYWGNPSHTNRSVRLSFRAPGFTDWWDLSFSTHQLGTDLAVGTYNAQRFPFEPAGSAGMDISGNGRGSNTLTGTFSILDLDFGPNGSLNRFAATFEQHSEGLAPALTGRIAYQSNVFAVPEPASLALLSLGVLGLFASRGARKAA